MDYSKTHYYKFANAAPASQTKSQIPDFERDDMPPMYGTGALSAQKEMPRRTNDVPAAPGSGPQGPATPTVPPENMPAVPGPGPENPPTPMVPPENPPAAPGTGPSGLPTPGLPGGGVTAPGRPGTGNILWSWAFLSPIFSNIASIAQARFYNVAAIQEPLDIYINGQLLVSDLDYGEYTDFLYIIPGYYTLSVFRRTNPNVPIISTRVNFVRNSTCLVSILGSFDNFSLQFIC